MNPPATTHSRYELREILGRGGMGVIYKAYDTLMHREVALKTILDVRSQTALDLFYREWGLQASITHPNIAEIYDIGQMELEGGTHPYFVMPLLTGGTLADLLRKEPHRLTVERVVGMMEGACRGLQAAHDKGLIHRDLKPSNVFILPDDAVKIIDFGIAHADSSAQTSVRGTLAYMAPELLLLKPASVATDIFALGVLTYEVLTRRRPFEGSNDAELSRSILHHNPPPASELNSSVSQAVARVVQKAIAKQPWSRWSSAREFGDHLQRALRNEPIEAFDPEKVRPRIERAARAFERAEYQVATEIITELESEGHIDPELRQMRRRVEQAQRQVSVKQYLENARRFYEEEEYTLALRKVQEALELDPENTDTAALQNEIEKKRRERKIEEWAQLARKHLDSNAFAPARSAVQSLLELKPGDPAALSLQSELARREEDFQRKRDEKSKLFNTAQSAWERGEVTSALSNLEKYLALDKTSPETDAERLQLFQGLYNQVRSEHEMLKSDYERARKLLADDSFAASLEICQQYLAKYPNHALFQALRFDVDERKRQNLSSFIAETDRRVEGESDLDRRVAILEEALKQHPAEEHFARALKVTRDKRDLVSGVVSRARLHEDQGRYSDALDQWDVLRAIHATYPGLEYEVERVRNRREAQARADTKAEWVARIDQHLDAREFERALDVAAQAQSEFPDDAELAELEKLIQQRREAHERALALVDKGQAYLAADRPEEGLEHLRKAMALDESSPVLQTALTGALCDRAREIFSSQPEQADALIREALEFDPQNSQALALRAQRVDKKKDEFITWCTAQARKLQAANDLDGAIAVIQQGLASHPNDARLNQLLSAFDRANKEQLNRQTRKRDLDAMAKLEEEVKTTGDAERAREIVREANQMAEAYRGDEEFQAAAGSIRQHSSALTATLLTSASLTPPRPGAEAPRPAPRPPQVAALPPEPPLAFPPVEQEQHAAPLPPPLPLPGAPPRPQPIPAEQAFALGASGDRVHAAISGAGKSKKLRAGLIAAAVLLLIVGIVAVLKRTSPPPPPPTVKVDLRTTPPGATIRIAGLERGVSDLQLDLQPGEYKAEADLQGYQPSLTTFTVREGAPVSVAITLVPWKPFVRVLSDLEGGKALLGERPMNPAQEGEFALDNLDPGAYKLVFSTPQGQVSAGISFDPSQIPTLNEPIQAKNVRLVVVNLQGARAAVYTSVAGAKAGIDGQPAQPIPPEGLTLTGLTRGAHQLGFEDGTSTRTLPLQVTGGPGAIAFVLGKNEADAGGILVTANEDNATITINDKYPYYRKTRAGVARLSPLKPGKYSLRLSKEGFETTAPQEVDVVAGQEPKLQFTLKAMVRLATLRLSGPPGTQVFVDNQLVGIVQGDGSFSMPITPGSHGVELRRGTARSHVVQRNFSAGETAQMANELALVQPNGMLRLDVTPAGAQLTVRLQGEPEAAARPVAQNPVSLPEGTYVIAATAPGHTAGVFTVSVASGGTSSLPIALRPTDAQQKGGGAGAAVTGMGAFDDPNGWVPDGPWMVRKGGGFVSFSKTPTGGVFTFTITLPKKTLFRDKSFQWFFGFTDARNYTLFKVDRRNFQRVDKVNGRDSDGPKFAHNLDKGGTFDVKAEVSGNRIVHYLGDSGRWIQVDEFAIEGRDLTRGKFGFFIPGSDEYGVRNFAFRPR